MTEDQAKKIYKSIIHDSKYTVDLTSIKQEVGYLLIESVKGHFEEPNATRVVHIKPNEIVERGRVTHRLFKSKWKKL